MEVRLEPVQMSGGAV